MDRPPPDAPPPPHDADRGAPEQAPPPRRMPSPWQTPISTVCAVVIIAIFTFALASRPAVPPLVEAAIGSVVAAWSGRAWTLLTTAFVHLDPLHFGFNLLALWGLGRLLELMVPRWQLALLVVVSAWVASAAQLAMSGGSVVGFSGVIYAMLGYGWIGGKRDPMLARFFTRETMLMPLLWLVGWIVAGAFMSVQIGNTAHVAGLAFGAALGVAFAWPGWRTRGLALAALITVGATVALFYRPWSMDWTALRMGAALSVGDAAEAERRLDFSLAHRLDPVDGALLRLELRRLQKDKRGWQEALEQLRALAPEKAEAHEAAVREWQEPSSD